MSTGETGRIGLWVFAWDDEGIAGTLAGTPGQAYAGGYPLDSMVPGSLCGYRYQVLVLG